MTPSAKTVADGPLLPVVLPFSASPQPPLPPPPIPQPEPKPGPTGKGIWIEAEKESTYQVADGKTFLKLAPGKHSTAGGYWYLGSGGDWLMYPHPPMFCRR